MAFIDLSANYQKQENIPSPPFEDQRNFNPLVLIIEKDDETRTMLKLWLEIWKFRYAEAKNGEQAINVAEEVNPDIVLLDISSANKDKFTAIRRIQNSPYLKNTPIILVSSYISFNSFSLTDGGEEFNILPMNFSSLENVLNEYRYKNDFYQGDLKVWIIYKSIHDLFSAVSSWI